MPQIVPQDHQPQLYSHSAFSPPPKQTIPEVFLDVSKRPFCLTAPLRHPSFSFFRFQIGIDFLLYFSSCGLILALRPFFDVVHRLRADNSHSADSDNESSFSVLRSSCPLLSSRFQNHTLAGRSGFLPHSVSYALTETGSFPSLSLSSFGTPDISGLPESDEAGHRHSSQSCRIRHPSPPFSDRLRIDFGILPERGLRSLYH